jgi:hypothetical protein
MNQSCVIIAICVVGISLYQKTRSNKALTSSRSLPRIGPVLVASLCFAGASRFFEIDITDFSIINLNFSVLYIAGG